MCRLSLDDTKDKQILRQVLKCLFSLVCKWLYGGVFVINIRDKWKSLNDSTCASCQSVIFGAYWSSRSLSVVKYLNLVHDLCVTAAAPTSEKLQ